MTERPDVLEAIVQALMADRKLQWRNKRGHLNWDYKRMAQTAYEAAMNALGPADHNTPGEEST